MVLRTHFLKAAIVSISFLILIFGASANSYAATHYVDKSANGANNGQSWKDAWESFADISWGSISVGDTIYISGGSTSKTYKEVLTVGASGSSGNKITITIGIDASHDGEVIIDGENSRSNGITLRSRNYITIDELTVKNHLGHGQVYASGCKNVTLQNSHIIHPRARGVRFHNCDNSLILNNTIETGAVNTGAQTDGIYIGNDGSNNIIDGNIIIINNSNSSPHVDPIQSYQETRLTVRNNYCEIVNGNTVSQGVIIQKTYGWIKFYNNIVLGSERNDYQACFFDQQSGNETIGDLYLWNNVCVDQDTDSGRAIHVSNWNESNIKEIKNNIGINPNGYCIQIDNEAGTLGTIDYNIWYRSNGGDITYLNGAARNWSEHQSAGYDANGDNSDPSLDSNYAPDDAGDPVVDAGTTIGDFNTDINGFARPKGTWDIGAYEFGGSPSESPTAPSPPNNLRVIN